MTGKKVEIYRSVKLTDNVKATELSTLDKIRLLLSKVGNDAEMELDTAEKLSADTLRKQAALSQFLDKAIDNMIKRDYESVTVKIPSDFKPYLNAVINPVDGKGRYYDFKVTDPRNTMDIKYNIIIRIYRKITE